MSDSKKQTTSSGREVRKVGMNDSKKSALAKLREARSGNIKRTDQYEVSASMGLTGKRSRMWLACSKRSTLKITKKLGKSE